MKKNTYTSLNSPVRPGRSLAQIFVGLIAAGSMAIGSANAAAVIGAQLYSTGGDVIVEVLPATAGYVSELHLFSPRPDRFITLNTDVGTITNLGSFHAGTELIFVIYVRDTSNTFYMGPTNRNPDAVF